MNLNATIIGQVISFVLFVWFCMKYIWFPLMSIIEKRQQEISDNLSNAKYVKIESDRIYSESLDCLKNARITAQEIISRANACKIRMLNEVKCEAEQERDRILLQTREQIIYEKKRVFEEIKNDIGYLVMEAAEKIIENSVNEKINNNLVNKVIEELSHNEDKI